MVTGTAAGPRRARGRLGARTAPIAGLVVAATLVLAAPASAFLFANAGPEFPGSVTVGQIFSATVGLHNFSTPPQSITIPVITASDIDLVPACTNTTQDCPGGIDAGVFQTTTGIGAGSGPASCTGTWTVIETTPGTFRLNPPGGNGSLALATGEICTVSFPLMAIRMPSVDASAAAGVQTNQATGVTFHAPAPMSRQGLATATTVNPAPIVPPADFNGDGSTGLSVYRPSTSLWYSTGSSVAWGTGGDIPVPRDYDFDGTTDRAVYRPSSGVWYVQGSSGGTTSVAWGATGDIPVPADFDGDGKTDRAVFRPSSGFWFVQRSAGGTTSVAWGATGDIPVPGDYDGDGRADHAVFRPSTGVWQMQRSTGGATSVGWGAAGDIPVPGDYDGDLKTDLAVFRPSAGAWFVQPSTGGGTFGAWGVSGDIPVPGDYDADDRTDQAVFRPSSGIWYVQLTSGGSIASAWGVNGDVPLPLPAAIGRFFFSPPFP